MAKVAGRTRQRPGLFGRTARRTVRLGMLATAVFVGRKTASGGRAKDAQGTKAGGSQGSASQGLGAAAGDGRSAGHKTDPDTTWRPWPSCSLKTSSGISRPQPALGRL
jgi:hypothetical protein